MKLTILSLKGKKFEGDAEGFNVKTTSGEITILDHHRPLVTILAKGTAIVIKSGEKREKLEINSGFLEMGPNNELSVLAD